MATISRLRERDRSSIAVLIPGADAIASTSDPASVILGWARGLGFDGLSYFAARESHLVRGAPVDLWSTWGEGWLANYRDRHYADVDPRLVATADQPLPCLWDGGIDRRTRTPPALPR